MKLRNLSINVLLVIILAFSFFNNTYKILQNPPSLFSDEVDANYQAFIFNHQQSDYFGNKFPVHFHSFSDWRTSLYIYSISFVQLFTGHNDLAARLPAAIYGTLTVLIFFLIIKNLFSNKIWGLIGAFLFSLSPWLIHYSRTGFEVSGMLFVILLGIYFWIKFIQLKKDSFLFLSIISFALSIYFYSTAKLFLFFVFIILGILWFKTLNSLSLKTKIIAILIVFVFCLPFISDTIKGRSGYRFSYINIFSDPTVSKTTDFFRQEDSYMVFGPQIGLKPMLISKIFHNKLSQWSEMFIKNYFSSFSTDFLFLKGDGNLRQGFQTAGYLLYPDLFLGILGISLIFSEKKSKNKKIYLFFIFSLICAPIPFALTRDSAFPHGTRLIIMLPFLIFLSLLGIKRLFDLTKSKLLITSVLIIYLICFAHFEHQYFYHYPNISAHEWHMGMKQSVLSSIENKNKWNRIYYSNSYEPFMPFFLNYSEFLPANKTISPADSFKWDNTNYFTGMQAENKFYLGNIEWSALLVSKPDKNNLYVVPEKDMVKIASAIEEYNISHSPKITLNQIKKINKQFTEQESFYLITFNF
jgi:4-amino-4-deoxy-L-arabinose transferase-like glycosyltransferase